MTQQLSPIITQGFGVNGDRANIVTGGFAGSISGEIIIVTKTGGTRRHKRDDIRDREELETWIIEVTNEDVYRKFSKEIDFDESASVDINKVNIYVEEKEEDIFEVLEIKINNVRNNSE